MRLCSRINQDNFIWREMSDSLSKRYNDSFLSRARPIPQAFEISYIGYPTDKKVHITLLIWVFLDYQTRPKCTQFVVYYENYNLIYDGCVDAVCGAPKRRFRAYTPDVSKNANSTDVRKARKEQLKRDEAIGYDYFHFLFKFKFYFTFSQIIRH